MFEVAAEHAPVVISTIAGYGVGAGSEAWSQIRIENERGRISADLGGVAEAPSKSQRLREALTGSLALWGATVGLINGAAWTPEEGVQDVPPGVNLIADGSGATIINDGRSFNRQVTLAKSINQEDGIEVSVLLARGGEVSPVDTADLESHQPFGDSPLRRAVSAAIKDTQVASEEAIQDNEARKGAVVLMTFGNSLGNTEELIEDATEESVQVPVHVVNVESERLTDNAVEDRLRELAQETGGKYWSRQEANAGDIINEVKKSLDAVEVPERTVPIESKLKWPLRAVGALGIVNFFRSYKRRRNEPFTDKSLQVKGNNK